MKSAFRSLGLALCLLAVYAVAQGAYPSSSRMIETNIAVPQFTESPAFSEREVRCVQRVIFGEARNQAYAAQVAVGASIVTRSLSGGYSTDLCNVAQQASQFKGYASSVSLPNDIEAAAWDQARAAAEHATNGYGSLPDQYRSTMFFRRAGTSADWMDKYQALGQIGDIVFYGGRSTNNKSA